MYGAKLKSQRITPRSVASSYFLNHATQKVGQESLHIGILVSALNTNTYTHVATNIEKIALALEILESAEASVRSAKQILYEVTGSKSAVRKQGLESALTDLNTPIAIGGDKIVEGVFDGERMLGSDKNEYAIPANYASKSKLVPGDLMKLTIKADGTFLYKQIAPIGRRHIIGTLTYDNGKYKVLAEGKLYNVLLASVTYFKGEVGDKVSLILPANQEVEWGAIDSIIPQIDAETIEEHE